MRSLPVRAAHPASLSCGERRNWQGHSESLETIDLQSGDSLLPGSSSFAHHDQQRAWPASIPPSVPCPPPPVPTARQAACRHCGWQPLWAHRDWLASAFLPWSAVKTDWKGSLFLLMAELPGSPVRVNGLPIYLLQTPCSPTSLTQEIKICNHYKVDIHNVKIVPFVLGFLMMKKKETIVLWEFMAKFYQPQW